MRNYVITYLHFMGLMANYELRVCKKATYLTTLINTIKLRGDHSSSFWFSRNLHNHMDT
jgi:hypothetical protein